MPRVLPATLLVVLTAGLWPIASAAQAPPQLPPGFLPPRDTLTQLATSIIRGHVYDASNGQPLRKVQVRVTSPELRENRLAITDNTGMYELKNLAAGRYNLTASKGSFVPLQYGQTRPFESGKPLELLPGQALDKVDFRLPRGAVVTGRVVDEAGEPASDVQVSVSRYSYVQGGRRQLTQARSATTNDIGEYRLFGIAPGQYFVSATLRSINANDAAAEDRSGYAPTYFPGTTNVTDAQRITLTLGQTLGDINIALSPARMARISGVAVTSDGKPVSNGMLLLAQTSGNISSLGTQIKPDGAFSLGGVAPGDYVIRVLVATSGPGAVAIPESVQANVTVAGEDINDLRLVGVKASTLAGRVVMPGSETDKTRFSDLMLLTIPKIQTPLGNSNGRANEDGTFSFQAQPGAVYLRLNPAGAFASVRIKTVLLNGVDVTDSGFEIRPNEDLSGLEVELTKQMASVTGMVTDARGSSVKDYTVLIFPRDRDRWEPTSRYLSSARPDQDGRYKASYILPGAYYAIALDYVEQGANTDPDFLERIRSRAIEFSINDVETKGLDLKLVTGM